MINITDYFMPDVVASGYVRMTGFPLSRLAISRLVTKLQKRDIQQYLIAQTIWYDSIIDVINKLNVNCSIDDAVGIQLDHVGDWVCEYREGRGDEEYREAIRYRIFVNTSEGLESDINKAVTMLTRPDNQYYWESGLFSYMTWSDGLPPQKMDELLRDISVAGSGEHCHFYAANPLFLSGVTKSPFLSVNNKRLKVAGNNKLRISDGGFYESGARLSGVSTPKLSCVGKTLRVNGKRIRLNTPINQAIIDSGFRLAGAYQ